MQRLPSRGGHAARPRPVQHSKSFARHDSSSPASPANLSDPLNVVHASNTSSDADPVKTSTTHVNDSEDHDDVFDRRDDDDNDHDGIQDGHHDNENNNVTLHVKPDEHDTDTDTFDHLPIEIQSVAERFLESLSLKAHPNTMSIEQLSELYQNFYVHTDSHIATHIAAMSSRLAREKSPAPSFSSASSAASRTPTRKRLHPTDKLADKLTAQAEVEQQMLTASEVSLRRRARRQLDRNRLTLEEAVERGVCEKVYPRLWRHTSTDDDERDEKLRSRAAALSVVGIGLRELLTTALAADESTQPQNLPSAAAEHDGLVRAMLSEARNSLERMNADRYPLAKLQNLTAAHKSIVDTLSQIFPSTSSADEVLPTLIYTIITSQPESIHIVSNFNFIERFRASNKLHGESAYCLTNLEAAISFLETVDLSSIRPSEPPEGPQRSNGAPTALRNDVSNPLYRGLPQTPPHMGREQKSEQANTPAGHTRRLSSLFNTRPKSFDAAGGVVMNGADTAIDTIHGALDTSFKFLFGRIKERQATQSPIEKPGIVVPKTLEDARQLVNSPNSLPHDDASLGEDSAPQPRSACNADGNDKILKIVGGRRPARDGSVDSSKSGGSTRKVASVNNGQPEPPTQLVTSGTSPSPAVAAQNASYAAVESMRTLSNTFNPLKGFSMRGFGRGVPLTSSFLPNPIPETSTSTLQTDGPSDRNGVDLSGIGPAMARFVDLKDARELNFFDIDLLLRDYQRLAGALEAARLA